MKKAKKCGKVSLVSLLCLLMLICSIPMGTASEQRPSRSVADTAQLRQMYLKKDEATKTLYPNGAIMFPLRSSELKMKEFYSFDVFRQGGTKGKATVKVSTIDLTAEYGTDYNIYTTNEINADPVKGKANPYYAIQNYSFIPVEGETETEYQADEDSEEEGEMRKAISEYNDTVNNEVMPTSSSFNLTFEDGESVRTIYIETLKSKYVRDDLQFYLSVSNPKNCEVGEVTTSMFTIKEEREKPESYVAVKDAKVNPKAGEAYVKINRTGNLGKTVNFTVKTKEGSANGVENYKSVCKSLTFLPGMTEIKLPVPLTDAKNETYFNVVLEDVSGAKVKDNSGEVLISSGASTLKNETGYSKTDTGYGTYKIDNIRNVELVDLSKLVKSQLIGHKADSSDQTFKYLSNNHMKIGYNGGAWNWWNYAISARTPNKVELTGVDKIHIGYNNSGGSTAWDYAAVYVHDCDPLDNGDSSCKWMNNLSASNGVSWNLTNISSSKLYKEINLPDDILGERFLFYIVQKGAFAGSCGVEFFNEGYNGTSFENNTYLLLKKYTVNIKDNNNSVMMYRDGKLQSVKSEAYSDLAFNSLTSKAKVTSVDMYRGESTSFSYTLDSTFKGKLRIVGYRLYKDGGYSSIISCDGEQFTLSAKLIRENMKYIGNNTINVQPVFQTVDSDVQIQSYENYGADDDNTGLSFKENSDKTSGVVTYNEKTIGTLKWNSTKRENQSDKYNALEGDDISFTYTPDPSCTEKWIPSFVVRQNDNEDMLSSTTPQIINATNNKCSVRIDKGHVRIRPIFERSGFTKLIVKNPGAGQQYTGKDTSFETKDKYTGESTVTGYYNGSNKVDFSKSYVGDIITFTASPRTGYRAKWQYTDSTTSKVKTYYGTNFFYAVQYAYEAEDNYVTLTFEKTEGIERASVSVTGKVLAKNGSIICPGSDEITQKDEDYVPAKNSTIMLESCFTNSDIAGNFILKNLNTDDTGINANAKIDVSQDEVHRSLTLYNGHYYITDIKIEDCLSQDKTSLNLDIRLPYQTYGITPTGVTVTDSTGITYSSSVTLYDKTVYSIKVDFDRSSESTDKPVNMVTFVVERDGLDVETFNEYIDADSSTVTLKKPLCESVKSQDKIFVEFYNVDGDKKIQKSYGRFETGLTFTPSYIEDNTIYAPDLGAESEATKSTSSLPNPTVAAEAPLVGSISPSFSVKGFSPIIKVGKTEQQYDGNDIYNITLGIQFEKSKDTKGKEWESTSLSDQVDNLQKKLDAFSKLWEGRKDKQQFQNLKDGMDLKTSTSVTFTAMFTMQLDFYYDESDEMCFLDSFAVISGSVSFRASKPFFIYCIPCYVFFNISGTVTGKYGAFPDKPYTGDGKADYLYSDELADPNKYKSWGVTNFDLNIGMGVGVGVDGLMGVNVQGSIDFNNTVTGVFREARGTLGLDLSVNIDLAVFSVSRSIVGTEFELYDTRNNTTQQVEKLALNALGSSDMLEKTKLKDLELSTESISAANDNLASRALKSKEMSVPSEDTTYPGIAEISDGVYFVASPIQAEGETVAKMKYMIYDFNNDTVSEPADLLSAIKKDTASDTESLELATEDSKSLTCDYDYTFCDCGKDILLVWQNIDITDCSKGEYEEVLMTTKIKSVFYNKETGKFHDYNEILDGDDNVICSPYAVCNKKTGTAEIFYKTVDFSQVTDNTSLNDVYEIPEILNVSACNINNSDIVWSTPDEIKMNEKSIASWDAVPYGNDIMITYVSEDDTSLSGKGVDIGSDANVIMSSATDEDTQTKNKMYIDTLTYDGDKVTQGDSILISDENHSVSAPQFAKIDKDNTENTLLFFKSDGVCGYQNIDNLISQQVYTDSKGQKRIKSDAMSPLSITDFDEDDNSVGDDLLVRYNENTGKIYALWVQNEGTEAQICVRELTVDGVDTYTERPVFDESGNATYDSDGNPVMTELDTPVNVIRGIWGKNAYLTQGGVKGTDSGKFKENVEAVVLDNGNILATYNAYDLKFTKVPDSDNDKVEAVNNQLVVGVYDTSPSYEFPTGEENEAISFSNQCPNAGETVDVSVLAKNTGVDTGRDVNINLYVNDELYQTYSVDSWYADEEQEFTTSYQIPDDADPSTISMYSTITDGENVLQKSEEFKFTNTSKVIITGGTITPVKYVTDENGNSQYAVTVELVNDGNLPYAGGDYVKFINHDKYAEAKSFDESITDNSPVYTSYGEEVLPDLQIGETKTVTFLSDEVPSSVFTNYNQNAAHLKFMLVPKDDHSWTEIGADDKFTDMGTYSPGVTLMPVPDEVKSVSADDIFVFTGKSNAISEVIMPESASAYADVKYTSKDEGIATVDEHGVVTGVKKGTTQITITAGGKSATVNVKVQDAPLYGDVDLDGQVTVKDATLVQKYLVKNSTLTDLQKYAANVFDKDEINIKDATYIQKFVNGSISSFPCEK